MCLAIPGQIVEIVPDERHVFFTEAKVNFGGVMKKVSLAYASEAKVGDYVLVHAGFALSIIDEVEAARLWDYLDQMNETREIQ